MATSHEEILLRMGFDGGAVQRGTQAMLASQKTASDRFSSMWKNAASTISGIFSGGIAGVSIGMVFNEILTKVSQIKNEAIQTGFDTDSIQKFNYQLGQMHVEIQAGQTGLGIMNKLIGQAAEGEKKAVEIFSRWGIATNGKSNAEIFEEIRAKIVGTVDPAQRVAMAMELFGRGGRELLPYLTANKATLDGMSQHAPIITKGDIESIELATQKIHELRDQLTMVGAAIISTPIEIIRNSPGWTETGKRFLERGGGATGVIGIITDAAFNKALDEHAAPSKAREEAWKRKHPDVSPAVSPLAVPNWHVTEVQMDSNYQKFLRSISAPTGAAAGAKPGADLGKISESTAATAGHLAALVNGSAKVKIADD